MQYRFDSVSNMPGLKFRDKIKRIQWSNARIPFILALIVIFAFFLRTYWAVGPSLQQGFAVSGGSDSYYHEKIIFYIINSRHQLLNDPMLNYPIGVDNPRPPLFHWGIVMLSYVFYPFMNPYDAALLALIIFPAIWGSLTIIPLYLLGKEAFNKKAGLLAAFFLAIMPAAITRSVATQADWDAFDLFFITWSFYFFLRALKTVNYKYWIRDWFNKESVKSGLKDYFKENKESMLYASLSGFSIAALALAWKGYTYAVAILVIYLFIQIFINRFRNKSELHMVFIIGLYMAFAFIVSLPWYFVTGRIEQWWLVPLLLVGGVFVLSLILEITGKYPWPLAIMITVGIIAVAAGIIAYFMPHYWQLIESGQGYFVKSKLYSTIAEAQAATLGYIAMSVGVAIFILSIGGILWMLYLIKKESREYYLFFVIFSVVAVYMAISAARFIFNASVAFALTGAIGLLWFIEKLRFKESFEEYKKYGGSTKKKLKSVVKFSQVAFVLIIVFLLIVPTVWSAIDAGIPYEEKKKYDKQIYNSMPSFMRPNETTYNKSSPWYLGAFGYSLPKPDYPWPRAWKWLSEQDRNEIPQDRPAFVSWWDYGFEAVREGQHPTVADNFQNGYQMAAQIITAQNESEVISLFAIRLLEGDFKSHGNHFSQGMVNILDKYFTKSDVQKIENDMANPSQFRDTVLSDPDYYGYYEKDISATNLKYVFLKGMFAHHSENFIINLYDSIRNYTGKDIRYFAVDYRLFPFSGRNTGIFYAPAKLGDRRIHQYGGTVVPYDFYELKAVDEYGNEYELDKIPANAHIVNYKITYKPMFYHSMLYKTFIGYSGQDVGASEGIPGISPSLYNYYPMQAWDMAHFKLVYRTAFWNPYKDYQNHSKDWKPIPIELALKYKKEHKGTVELNPPAYRVLPNDVVMVKFYEGAVIEGNVTLTNGEPAKNIRITLFDEYGIPHVTTFTDAKGHYRIPAVAGNLTLVVSTNGHLNKLRLVEKTIIAKVNVNVSEAMAMRLKPNFTIVKNIKIKPSNLDGIVYYDVNANNKFDEDRDVKLNNAVFVLRNDTYGFNKTAPVKNGRYSIKNIPPHAYSVDIIINGRYFKDVENITIPSGQNLTEDVGITPSYIHGNVTYDDGKKASNATVELVGIYTSYTIHTNSSGSFSVMVVPDNYTVVAYSGSYRSDSQVVIVNLWNYTTSVNLTLRHAFDIKVKVLYNHMPVEGMIIKLTQELVPHSIYIVKTDKEGEFELEIPGGIYEIYSTGYIGSVRVAYSGLVNLGANMSFTINLQKAYKVYGYVHAPKGVSSIEVGIYTNTTFYRSFANNTGYFEAYLPAGNYIVGVVGFNNSYTPFFGREVIHLVGDREVNVVLHKAYNVTGVVYYDKNGNENPDNDEIIRNGLVCLYDANGVYEIRNIPPDGKFILPTTINYHIKAILWGYAERGVAYEKEVKISVMPSMVHVRGHIYFGHSENYMPVNIRFSADNRTYNVTNVKTEYDVYLPPGNYTVSLYGFNRSYTVMNNNLMVNLGYSEQTYNITFKAYAHVVVVSQADEVVWYVNGRNYTSGKSLTLPIGNYSVYARNETHANIVSENITSNCTIEIPIYPAYYVTFNITNYSLYNTVYVKHGNAWISTQGYIKLPFGEYNFTIFKVKFESGSYYAYHAYNETVITGNSVVGLNVEKSKLLTSLSGKLVGATTFSNAIISFIPLQNHLSEVYLVTDSSGHFHGSITPGTYLLYTYFISANDYYANVSIVHVHGKSMSVHVEMERGYMLNGGTYLKGNRVATKLHIRIFNGTITLESTGYYWIVLPAGNYTISSEINRTEFGMSVDYSFNTYVLLQKNTNLDIHLARDTVHVIDATVISHDIFAKPNSTMGVVLYVVNHGNTVENVSFEGIGEWSVQNAPKIKLYPNRGATVSLNVHVPITAKFGNNSVQLRVLFSGLSQDVNVYTNVTARYAVELKEISHKWVNNSLEYSVKLTNKGNVKVNYNLSIINAQELSYKGWNVRIAGDNGTHVTLDAGQTRKIVVIAIAKVPKPSTVTQIQLSVYDGYHSKTIKMKLYYPEIKHMSLYVKGENVENYTGITIEPYYYWVWGAVVALAVAIVFIGRYKR